MVLKKQELVSSFKDEIRLLLHLIGKIDESKLDYRPTPKQRSTLELLQYLAIMAPTQIAVFKAGVFTRAALTAAWTPAVTAANACTFDQTVAAIQKQSDDFERIFREWSDADFRSEVILFGNKNTRGYFLVNSVLSGFAAYRMQLFCYLKLCGREELSTVDLWMGLDNFTPPA